MFGWRGRTRCIRLSDDHHHDMGMDDVVTKKWMRAELKRALEGFEGKKKAAAGEKREGRLAKWWDAWWEAVDDVASNEPSRSSGFRLAANRFRKLGTIGAAYSALVVGCGYLVFHNLPEFASQVKTDIQDIAGEKADYNGKTDATPEPNSEDITERMKKLNEKYVKAKEEVEELKKIKVEDEKILKKVKKENQKLLKEVNQYENMDRDARWYFYAWGKKK